MEKVFASSRSPLEISVAVVRTSQSPFPLCDMPPKIALKRKIQIFETQRNWIQTEPNCAKGLNSFSIRLNKDLNQTLTKIFGDLSSTENPAWKKAEKTLRHNLKLTAWIKLAWEKRRQNFALKLQTNCVNKTCVRKYCWNLRKN